ncbi:MAG TPA: hypothetical protein VFO34_10685 [Candidatus Acidoferrales bacterium]|nr:hypothetical protein [Candidatus Acidoferrales bacterium]
MISNVQLFRLFNELIFVLLGGLVIWVGATGRFLFNPRQPTWLVLSGLVMFLGIAALVMRRAGAGVHPAVAIVRGVSLILVAAIMVSMAWASFRMITLLMMLAGAVLALRGVVGGVLVMSVSPR